MATDNGDTPAWLSGPAQAPLTASEAGAPNAGGHGASQGIWAERDDDNICSSCTRQVPTRATIQLWSTFCCILSLGLFVYSFCGENHGKSGTGGPTQVECSSPAVSPPFAFHCPNMPGTNSTLVLSCGYKSSQLAWRFACIFVTFAYCGVLHWALKNSKDYRFILNVAALGLAVCTFIAMCVDSSAVRNGHFGSGMKNPCPGTNAEGYYVKKDFIGVCAWDAINSIALFYLTFLLFRFRKADAYSDI